MRHVIHSSLYQFIASMTHKLQRHSYSKLRIYLLCIQYCYFTFSKGLLGCLTVISLVFGIQEDSAQFFLMGIAGGLLILVCAISFQMTRLFIEHTRLTEPSHTYRESGE